ncbi:hypothetical protein SDC9_161818 [bioreactor metagenome]|uniref:Uncharacterized protein n=1 Tax=bioreactor metagenome TaxID=1076179 RepID=A0A645FJD2_9ZZZZ
MSNPADLGQVCQFQAGIGKLLKINHFSIGAQVLFNIGSVNDIDFSYLDTLGR